MTVYKLEHKNIHDSVAILREQSGFKDFPKSILDFDDEESDFYIEEVDVDKNAWAEGLSTYYYD